MLKNHLEGWSLVLSGHWEPLIFVPDWLSRHLTKAPQIGVDVPPTAGLPPRFHFDDISLVIVEGNLLLSPDRGEDSVLVRMEEVALQVLSLLPHTPLFATGINFAFVESHPGPLADVFKLPDGGALERAGFQLLHTKIRRQLRVGEDIVRLTLEQKGSAVLLTLNYHFETPHTQRAREVLKGQLLRRKEQTRELLEAIYNLKVEGWEGEGPVRG